MTQPHATCAARRRCATTRTVRLPGGGCSAPISPPTHSPLPLYALLPAETASGFPDCLLQQMPALAAAGKKGKRAVGTVERVRGL